MGTAINIAGTGMILLGVYVIVRKGLGKHGHPLAFVEASCHLLGGFAILFFNNLIYAFFGLLPGLIPYMFQGKTKKLRRYRKRKPRRKRTKR